MILRAFKYFIALMIPSIILLFIIGQSTGVQPVASEQVYLVLRIYIGASFLIAFLRNTIEKQGIKKKFDSFVLSRGLVGFGFYMATFYYGISLLLGENLSPAYVVGGFFLYSLIGLMFGFATKPRDRKSGRKEVQRPGNPPKRPGGGKVRGSQKNSSGNKE